MIVPVGDLALQAVVAFIVDNFAGGFYCRYLTLMGTGLAGCAAFYPAAQPVKNTKAGDKAQPGSQWAQVFAVEFTV